MEKLSKIEEKLFGYLNLITPEKDVDWNDLFGFERNWKRHYKTKEINKRLDFLHTWRSSIGKEVYKRGVFGYILTKDMDDLNKSFYDTSVVITFTEELFKTLCIDYLAYQIKRITEELTERSITSNSTSKIHNLAFEWSLECTQEILKFFKDLQDETK